MPGSSRVEATDRYLFRAPCIRISRPAGAFLDREYNAIVRNPSPLGYFLAAGNCWHDRIKPLFILSGE
jgi:hypothetical protein